MLKQSAVLAVLIVSVIVVAGCTSTGKVTESPKISVQEIKANAQTIPYDSLARYNEEYIGKIVYYRGKILQSNEVFGDNYVFRIATKQEPYLGYFGDVVWVNYNGRRFLENDVVDLWGNVKGLNTYTAVFGNEITIPEVDSIVLELVDSGDVNYGVTTTSPTLITKPSESTGSQQENVSVKFQISEVDSSWFYGNGYISSIKYIIENLGNTEITPTFHVKITESLRGRLIYENDIDSYTAIKPGKTVADNIGIFESIDRTGKYLVGVSVLYNDKEISYASESVVLG